MDLGPAFPVAPELGVMSRRAPSLVWERLRVPSLVWERLRLPSLVWERLREPSSDETLEPEAVRERIRRVMLAEGTGERRGDQLSDGHLHTSNGAFSVPALAGHLHVPSILTVIQPLGTVVAVSLTQVESEAQMG